MRYQPINICSEREGRRNAVYLFLIGLFSQTQVNLGGKLGISEFAMITVAPFLFVKNFNLLRIDKVLLFFSLILLWLSGAVFVDVYSKNYFNLAMRGIAVPITVFANCLCIYVLLRGKIDNLKWFLLGQAISCVVSIFVFQSGTAGDLAAEYGMGAGIERVVGYKLFWTNIAKTWLTLPIVAWYLKTPRVYSLLVLLFLSLFNLVSGGRSLFIVMCVSFLIVLVGGKTKQSLAFMRKHIVTMLLLLGVVMYIGKSTYKYVAKSGMIGDYEASKYEMQTKSGEGILQILMSGRREFFIALKAALDKPIIGHGSLARDEGGYVLDFVTKYGSDDELRMSLKAHEGTRMFLIPYHTHIMTFWMWHGIFGLLFWTYVIWLAIKILFRNMDVCPSMFGYFAVIIPAFIWDVLFSPFGSRVWYSAFFVVMLLVSHLRESYLRR